MRLVVARWFKTWVALVLVQWAIYQKQYLMVGLSTRWASSKILKLFSLRLSWRLKKFSKVQRVCSIPPHHVPSIVWVRGLWRIFIFTWREQLGIVDVGAEFAPLTTLRLLLLSQTILLRGLFNLLGKLGSVWGRDRISSANTSWSWSIWTAWSSRQIQISLLSHIHETFWIFLKLQMKVKVGGLQLILTWIPNRFAIFLVERVITRVVIDWSNDPLDIFISDYHSISWLLRQRNNYLAIFIFLVIYQIMQLD